MEKFATQMFELLLNKFFELENFCGKLTGTHKNNRKLFKYQYIFPVENFPSQQKNIC